MFFMWIVDSLDILRKSSENLENRNDYVLFKVLVLEVWLQVDLMEQREPEDNTDQNGGRYPILGA